MNTKEKTPPDFSRERKRKELEKRRKNNQNLQVLNFSYIRGCGGDSCISPKSRSTHLKLRYKLNTECLMRLVRFFLSFYLQILLCLWEEGNKFLSPSQALIST